ncbi:MAG: hemolysin family protein [Thermoanaerobaculales bacterium]
MTEALLAWWANPVTALLVALALLLALIVIETALFAVVRFGAIPLGGLLAQRERLLPTLPRRGNPFAGLVLFLQGLTGVVVLLYAITTLRAGHVTGMPLLAVTAMLFLGVVMATVVALGIARGPRLEGVVVFALWALWPATALLRAFVRLEAIEEKTTEAHGDQEVDEHEVQAFIGAGEDAGILERGDGELVASIVELSETVAREIMTPRTDVVALPVDADFASVQQRFADSMFTRIPVYRETLDRIEGVVHVKDVLRAVARHETPTADDLLHPVLLAPETKALKELLREFQAARQQLAVVVDEYGGTSGIVTLEDVLEEIVGEIRDEHQSATPEVVSESDGAYLLHGGAHVEVLEDLFGVQVADAGFDSVAGMVLDRLGHLPRVGEVATWEGIELEVVEVDRRRLRRLRVRRAARAEA